jgi:hypothetical protein
MTVDPRRMGMRLIVSAVLILPGAQVSNATENQGFIYGRVVTESGAEYTGFLRWGNQEVFWDDLFQSEKEDLPYFDYLDDQDYRELHRDKDRNPSFLHKLHRMFEGKSYSEARIFISRFGDIKAIEPRGDDGAVVRMKNGSTYEVGGYSDDVTSKIHVSGDGRDAIDLRWDRIESIEFMPAPAGAEAGVRRLYGRVETAEGDFEGYIQWDKQECLDIDELDGDTEDGDVSIPMGRIRAIEKDGRRACEVTLDDGSKLHMHGTNDVNHENRGIMVEDPRFGRVTIGWSSFDRLTFMDSPGSGLGYDAYPGRGPLAGTVAADNGKSHTGRLVFDLDESEGWEILNGNLGDIQFDIPFHRVVSLEPRGRNRCQVGLSGGEAITLEDSQDVGRNNSGVLIFERGDDEPVYVKWRDVDRIELEHQD